MKSARFSLLAFAALLATSTCFAEDAKDTDSPDTLIATVNGTPYPLDVFRIFFMERMQGTRSENPQALQQQAFDEFMGLIVASQQGEKLKLEDDRSVVAALALARMKVMSNAALTKMAEEMEPSEDQLKQAYEQFKEQAARTEFKARHILVKEEDEAKKLIKQLDKGADFDELAKKNSLGPTAKNGGELGWFDPSQMVAPFSEAVAAMKPGDYSKEPVHTQFGWHIINLQETRKAEPPTFDEAKPRLVAAVKRQMIAEKIGEMRNNAMVELNEDVVKVKQIGAEDK